MATTVVNAPGGRTWRLRFPKKLPDLSGKWLTAYSVLWAVALLVAIVAPIRTTVVNYRGLGHPVWRPHGIVVKSADAGIGVATVFGDEARGPAFAPAT